MTVVDMGKNLHRIAQDIGKDIWKHEGKTGSGWDDKGWTGIILPHLWEAYGLNRPKEDERGNFFVYVVYWEDGNCQEGTYTKEIHGVFFEEAVAKEFMAERNAAERKADTYVEYNYEKVLGHNG